MTPYLYSHTCVHTSTWNSLLALLGSGQFGKVSKAAWTLQDETREVAVKSLTPEADEVDKVKFLQEAVIMMQFRHPNVVQLFGIVTEGGPVSLGNTPFLPSLPPSILILYIHNFQFRLCW